jgi:hypothetical protein
MTPLFPCSQPDAPLQLSGTASQIATLVWQVAAKNNQLDKVQDELAQVGAPPCPRCSCSTLTSSLVRNMYTDGGGVPDAA